MIRHLKQNHPYNMTQVQMQLYVSQIKNMLTLLQKNFTLLLLPCSYV